MDEIEKVSQGRRAMTALGFVGPELDEMRQGVITRMKQMYIAGEATEVKLLAAVGELVTLDRLETSLRRQMRVGEAAQRKLNNE